MLNITLPDQVLAFVEEQTKVAGFSTTSEYVCHLILREQERVSQQEQIESLLLNGLESGDPVEATDNWWDRKRDRLVERFHQTDA
jgi:antitoxin ParD1/3/4